MGLNHEIPLSVLAEYPEISAISSDPSIIKKVLTEIPSSIQNTIFGYIDFSQFPTKNPTITP